MMQFFRVKTPDLVIQEFRERLQPLDEERVRLRQALGRVLAKDVCSPEDLPNFHRAIMDGYAVRAQDTFGATASTPAYLRVTGEVLMGEETNLSVGPGEAIAVATGGMLPANADAVVMVEYTDRVDADLIEVHRAVAPWENVVRIGEDIPQGSPLLDRGRILRPQDIGALAALGILHVSVFRQPRIGIISTGDEVVPPETTPRPGQIRDINSFSLEGLIRERGGIPVAYGLVPDQADRLRQTLHRALQETDMVLISGGSSVGTRDMTLQVIDAIPGAELLVHGVSIRPGKPLIGAMAGDKGIFGLPGNPVSVMVVFDRIVTPLIHRLQGLERPPYDREVIARLSSNYASDPGREDHVRVRLVSSDSGLLAEPVLGKSALITTMVRADGEFVVPIGVEGVEAGERVTVRLF